MQISEFRDLLANDGFAATFQTMGQYRTELLQALDKLRAQADARPVAWLSPGPGEKFYVTDEALAKHYGYTRAVFDRPSVEASAPGLSDEALGELWQELNNAAARNTPDRKPVWLNFARAILSRASAATVAEPSEQFEHLDLQNHQLRRAVQKMMARLTELLDEDKFAEMESIAKGAGVAPPEASQQQAEPGAGERAAFLSNMDALDLKEFRELTGCHSPADYRMKLEDLHGGEESLAAEYLQDKVFEDMRLMYKAMGEFDNKAVDRFAEAMKRKMAASRKKGRNGWDDPAKCPPERLAQMLIDHLVKGDPVDVGNFAMMLFNRPDADGALARAAQSGQRAGVVEGGKDAD